MNSESVPRQAGNELETKQKKHLQNTDASKLNQMRKFFKYLARNN